MKSLALIALSLPVLAQTSAPPVPVTAAPVVVGPWAKIVILPAEALPYFRANLGTTATGWVDALHADIGSRVKKGELLAVVNAPELTAASEARAAEARAAKQKIAQAESVLHSSEALAAAALSEFTRISSLAESGTVTYKARDEAQARLDSAKARVGEAQAGMIAAEADALAAEARATEAAAALAYTKITAPFDGIVVERHAELGDFLGPSSGRDKLFVIEQIDPLRIRIQIPEHAAALASVGDAATLRIAGQEIAAKLDRVSGSLDPSTKTMTAEVDVRGNSLLPGSLGSATIEIEKLDSAVLVPLAALQTSADGARHVIVMDGGAQREVTVKLAAVDGKTAVLSQGPVDGQQVVIP